MDDRERRVRAAFLQQAKACRELGSLFTARLCALAGERLDRGHEVGRAILEWEGDPSARGDAVPLRLAGGLHGLVIAQRSAALSSVYPPHHGNVSDDALWLAVSETMRDHPQELFDWLGSAPQTNEVRRSAILLPGFLTIAHLTGRPLVLSEIGASAGLNLRWDRYSYQLGRTAWGEPTSPVQLAPRWEGPAVEPVAITIADRAGCDLNPLDPASADDRVRLLSYIWADQADRMERTRAAFEIAIRHEVSVERADAAEWLQRRLRDERAGSVHVVFHTIVWQYLPPAVRETCAAAIARAGRRADASRSLAWLLAWLRLENDGKTPGAALTLTLWPGGRERVIARGDFHGRWIEWLGWHGAA